jgi:hypothetical protein
MTLERTLYVHHATAPGRIERPFVRQPLYGVRHLSSNTSQDNRRSQGKVFLAPF